MQGAWPPPPPPGAPAGPPPVPPPSPGYLPQPAGYAGYPAPPPGTPAPGFPTWAWSPPAVGWGRFRAQSFGELLDAAFTVYRRKFLPIVAIMALFQLPYLAVQLFGERSVWSSLATLQSGPVSPAQLRSETASVLGATAVLLAVTLAYYVLLLPLAEAAVVKVVGDDYLDRPTGVGAALGLAVRRAAGVIGFLLLELAVVGVPPLVLFALGILVGGAGGAGIAVVALVGGGVYAVVVVVRLSLGVQALILERLSPRAALRRSLRLTRGSFWRILLFYVVIVIVGTIVGGLLQGVAGLFIHGLSTATQLEVTSLADGVVGVFTSPFILILLTLVYYDIRIRREGFDLEMLARSL